MRRSGNLAGAEGVAVAVRDAGVRHAVPDGRSSIPASARSYIAPLESLPDMVQRSWEARALQWGEVREGGGRDELRAVARDDLLAPLQAFEELVFDAHLAPEMRQRATLAFDATRDGTLRALVTTMRVRVDAQQASAEIDSADDASHWRPRLLPLPTPGVPIREGQRIVVVCDVTQADGRAPRYTFDLWCGMPRGATPADRSRFEAAAASPHAPEPGLQRLAHFEMMGDGNVTIRTFDFVGWMVIPG